MIRRIAAVVLGIALAIALIMALQALGHAVYPPPEGIDVNDPESLQAVIDQLPLGALLFVILSYVGGTFGGGLLATFIARERPLVYAGIVGAFVLLGTVMTLVSIAHPTWFAISAVAAILVTVFVTGRLGGAFVSEAAQAATQDEPD